MLSARHPPNPQSFLRLRPLQACSSGSQVFHLHYPLTLGEKDRQPVRPSSPRPRLGSGSSAGLSYSVPVPGSPKQPPASSARGKKGGGAGEFPNPCSAPTDHHSLVPPGYAVSERFRGAPLGRDWGCSSVPDSCHHCSSG